MRRWSLRMMLMMVLMCMVCSMSAEVKVWHAKVVDDFGDPMPSVTVGTSKTNRTITNGDGEFELRADGEEELTFSFVGFKTVRMKARNLSQKVMMQEAQQMLHEVVVSSESTTLEKIRKKLSDDYHKYGNKDAHYFNRVMLNNDDQSEMIECFLKAEKAVNLRGIKVCSGKFYSLDEEGVESNSSLKNTNVNLIYSLGPQIRDVWAFHDYITPLSKNLSRNDWLKYYEIEKDVVDEEGKTLLVYHFKHRDTAPKTIMDGTIYVDADTYTLKRFDGRLNLYYLVTLVSRETRLHSAEVKIIVNYATEDGYAEVDNMYLSFQRNSLMLQSVMVNVERYNLHHSYGEEIKNNLLDAIVSAGDSPYLESREGNTASALPFIQRTAIEEGLVINSKASAQPSPNGEGAPAKGCSGEAVHERAYLHLDNSAYFIGDRIWLKAYVTRTDTHKPTDLSRTLYVELLTPGGEVIETRKLKIVKGMASGDILLDKPLHSGYYEVRAYTRYMTGWGTEACFSKVIPIFSRPKTPSDYSKPTIEKISYAHRLPEYRNGSPATSAAAQELSSISPQGWSAPKENGVGEASEGISIESENEFVRPYGKVRFTVHAEPYTMLSMAVCDVATMYNGRTGNVRDYMLAEDRLPREAADTVNAKREKGLLLEGHVMAKKTKKGAQLTTDSVRVSATMYNQLGNSLSGQVITDREGHFTFPVPEVRGTYQLQMKAEKPGTTNDYFIGLSRNFSPSPRMLSKEECERVPIDTTRIYRWKLLPGIETLSGDDKHRLKNVDVKGKRSKLIDKLWGHESFVRSHADIYYDCVREADILADNGEEMPGFMEWLKRKNSFFHGTDDCSDPLLGVYNKYGDADVSGRRLTYLFHPYPEMYDRGVVMSYAKVDDTEADAYVSQNLIQPERDYLLLWADGLTYKNRPIIWVKNGRFCTITGYNLHRDTGDYIYVINNDNATNLGIEVPSMLDDVVSMYISEDISQAKPHINYEEMSERNFVVVNVFAPGSDTEKEKGVRKTTFAGYDYKNLFDDDDENRRTVYWNPNVMTDKYGNATVEFYNNSSCTQMYISIAGMTRDGRFVSKE